MPTFNELRERFLYNLSSPRVTTYENSHVTPLIFTPSRGKAYFGELRRAINQPGVNLICIAGWWLDSGFSLDGASGHRTVDLLKAKARAGVDIRVMGWVMAPDLLQHPLVQSTGSLNLMYKINGDTMRFIEELRTEPALRDKACLNILSHPAGAVHSKMAIVGGTNSIGFTGGIDLEGRRHETWWHDVEAKVTGPAVQGLFDFYREMWNELRSRPVVPGLTAQTRSGRNVTIDSHTTAMPPLAPTLLRTSPGRMVVQSVSTLPQYNFPSAGFLTTAAGAAATLAGTRNPLALPRNAPLSYARRGRFQVKAVWEKALKAARQYIYIEDQAFTAAEVFTWINHALKHNNELRVILVIGGTDPTAPSPAIMDRIMNTSVNSSLLSGLSASQIARIGLFRYFRPLGATSGSSGLSSSNFTKFVHTKSTIIDDAWALVGSANCMRRSLYTDFEHAVAFMDPGSAVPDYRTQLWKEHLMAEIPNLGTALSTWFAIPTSAGPSVNPLDLKRIPLHPVGSVLRPVTLSSGDRVCADEILDADSRSQWGNRLVEACIRLGGTAALSP